ncbi:MAG: hypothetical protein PSX36_11775 [bacterium]|nr:hypothetical protein [bacterium]
MKKTIPHLIFLLFIGLSLLSCKKTAGEGGSANIRGSVWVEDWNTAFTIKNGEYAGADTDVYIIYGNDLSYGDKTKASYDGSFEFKYLREGNYKVYVYSKDRTFTSQSGDTVFVKEVTVNKRKQTITLDQFTIYK